ncbi:MAG: acylphosphatase [Chitinophagaceae bacterium]|nr:MAG: acylphosphatase [Chitinophagaceae bacterium]
MTAMSATGFIIKGKVQGVYFRESARKEAEKLHLTGWIRNNTDGSVEGAVFGDPAVIDKFILWCHKGPLLAHVTEVSTHPTDAVSLQGFEVRRG